MVQFPKRRETDEQAEERKQKIKDYNEAYGCDAQGRPVNSEGELLRNFKSEDIGKFGFEK